LNGTEFAASSTQCLAEVLKETARRCGGSSLEQQGLLLVAGTHPCPIFVNSALRTGNLDAEEAVSRASTFFAERRNGYEFWIREGADDDLEKAAAQSGMRFSAELRGMVLQEPPEDVPSPPGTEVRRVESIQDFQSFVDIVAEGFQDEAPGCYELIRSIFPAPATVLSPDTAAFLVYADGKAVSASLTMLKERVAWIGWIATREQFRGRGFGRLATVAATRAGFTLGANLASLEATKMGAPVYLRIGFQEVIRYRNYSPGIA
jgi:GNAT superfamily N-acetyltransferase